MGVVSGHHLFVKSDGSLWGMGYNYGGQLGDGTTTDRHTPERIVGVGPIPGLLITSVSRAGNDLHLSFVSESCRTYNVLSTSYLATSNWNTLLTRGTGNGGIGQVPIPPTLHHSRQIFIIQQGP